MWSLGGVSLRVGSMRVINSESKDMLSVLYMDNHIPTMPPEAGASVTYPVLRVRTRKLSEAKLLAQDHDP